MGISCKVVVRDAPGSRRNCSSLSHVQLSQPVLRYYTAAMRHRQQFNFLAVCAQLHPIFWGCRCSPSIGVGKHMPPNFMKIVELCVFELYASGALAKEFFVKTATPVR